METPDEQKILKWDSSTPAFLDGGYLYRGFLKTDHKFTTVLFFIESFQSLKNGETKWRVFGALMPNFDERLSIYKSGEAAKEACENYIKNWVKNNSEFILSTFKIISTLLPESKPLDVSHVALEAAASPPGNGGDTRGNPNNQAGGNVDSIFDNEKTGEEK